MDDELPKNLVDERIGTIKKNKYGSIMKVIEYNRSDDIWVKFEQGNPVHANWYDFMQGNVKSMFDKTIFGIGYIGEGQYKVSVNEKITPEYRSWNNMLKRCYYEKSLEKSPTYREVSVCNEWHNFQNFAKWWHQNYYKIDGQRMQLDKDILIKGNKVYSPDTCVFVPQFINTLFINNKIKRGKFPLGVSWNKRDEIYAASSVNDKKNKNLGSFDNPIDAFYAYKSHKEKYIKEVAEQHKHKIPEKLYNAMINYTIEITD